MFDFLGQGPNYDSCPNLANTTHLRCEAVWYSKGTFKYTFETQSTLATCQAVILNSVTFKDVCKHTCVYSNI